MTSRPPGRRVRRPEPDMAEAPKGRREDMPKRKNKFSKAEFVRRFTGEAMKYLESLPPDERDARIEALGRSVVRSSASWQRRSVVHSKEPFLEK